jgi:predicted glycosyltransferase
MWGMCFGDVGSQQFKSIESLRLGEAQCWVNVFRDNIEAVQKGTIEEGENNFIYRFQSLSARYIHSGRSMERP